MAVDPAKRSHTVEVLDRGERVLATLRVQNTTAGYRELRAVRSALAAAPVGSRGCSWCRASTRAAACRRR